MGLLVLSPEEKPGTILFSFSFFSSLLSPSWSQCKRAGSGMPTLPLCSAQGPLVCFSYFRPSPQAGPRVSSWYGGYIRVFGARQMGVQSSPAPCPDILRGAWAAPSVGWAGWGLGLDSGQEKRSCSVGPQPR